MKSILSLVTLLLLYGSVHAQATTIVSDSLPISIDGITYGYTIRNVSTREVSGNNYSRYEVTLYAKNNSNCMRMFLYQQRSLFGTNATANDDIARFDCVNATGARLTSKSGTVNAMPFYTTGRARIKDCADGKEKTQDIRVQIGFALKPNEVVTNNLIFITPLGEKPQIQVTPAFNPPSF